MQARMLFHLIIFKSTFYDIYLSQIYLILKYETNILEYLSCLIKCVNIVVGW